MVHKELMLIITTILLTGCSITALPKQVQGSIVATDDSINSANKAISTKKTISNRNFITYSDSAYFGSNVIQLKHPATLPKAFSETVSVDKYFTSLSDIADTINRLTGIPTYVDQNGQTSSANTKALRVTQQFGTLTDMLDSLAAKTDTSWTYRNGKIILAYMDSQTWSIKLIPGNIQVQNQVNNNSGIAGTSGKAQSISSDGESGSGGGGGGSSSVSRANQATTQNITFNLAGDVWKDFESGVKQLLSKSGKMSINPQTSSVTVIDKPSVLSKVDEYIKNQNDIMKRVVQVDVQVLSVETKVEDNYGINWNLALKVANANFSINGQASQIGSGVSSANASPIFVPTNTTQAFTIGVPLNSGDLGGSQLILNALSSISKVSNITSTAATTLSNQPVPINFTDQISYLASVQNTISAQGLSQQSLTPGQITVGFSLNILPVIEDDGVIRMQISLNLSNLKQMAPYGTGGSTIQLPTIGNRSFMQKVAMRDGDTFVVTSFDASLDNLFQNGVGGATNWWVGGGVSAGKNKSRLVILVTPHILN